MKWSQRQSVSHKIQSLGKRRRGKYKNKWINKYINFVTSLSNNETSFFNNHTSRTESSYFGTSFSAFQKLEKIGLRTLSSLFALTENVIAVSSPNSLDSKWLPAVPKKRIYSQLMKTYYLGRYSEECVF